MYNFESLNSREINNRPLWYSFLVGAFNNKKARLLQSLVFKFFSSRQTRSDEISVRFVQLNEYVGNASKLSQRVPPFSFYFLNAQHTKPDETKGSSFIFSALRLFLKIFVSKGPPLILLKSPLVISGIKRYIRNFDLIPELYCVFVRRRWRSKNRSFLNLEYSADF